MKVPTTKISLNNLPEDNESLKVILRSLLAERDREKQRSSAGVPTSCT